MRGPRNVPGSIRPLNGVMASSAVWIGWAVQSGDPSPFHIPLLLLMGSAFAIVSGANLLNDLGDMETDSKGRPEKRTLNNASAGRSYLNTAVLLWSLGLFATLASSLIVERWQPMAILVISMLLVLSYELWSKRRGLTGNITVSVLVGLTFVFGSSAAGGVPLTVISFFFMASFLNVSRELIKDMEDMEKDADERTTFPIRYGTREAWLLARLSAFSGIGVSFFLIVFGPVNLLYLVVVLIADMLIARAVMKKGISPPASQRTLKAGMIFALISFYSFSLF